MGFMVADPGTAFPRQTPKPRLPRLVNVERDWTSPGAYEPVRARLEGAEWAFERTADGKWGARTLPDRAEAKAGLRSMSACRGYVNSGRAAADLERPAAHDRGEHETKDRKCPKC